MRGANGGRLRTFYLGKQEPIQRVSQNPDGNGGSVLVIPLGVYPHELILVDDWTMQRFTLSILQQGNGWLTYGRTKVDKGERDDEWVENSEDNYD